MKPKALMLSAAVLLGSAALAFAQTNSQPPQTPAGQAAPQAGATQNMNDNAPAGSKSTMSGAAKPGSSDTKQAQAQPAKTAKHRVMASRRHEPRATSDDRETTALNLLEEKGYRDFSSFRPAGRGYEVTASQNGKSVTVTVNPDTKSVRTRG